MAEATASRTFGRFARSSSVTPCFRRSASPARASSPGRLRAVTPVRAQAANQDSSLSRCSARKVRNNAHGTHAPSFSPFCPSSRTEVPSRPQGLYTRQAQGRSLLSLTRPVHTLTSVKFPGSTEEETQRDAPVAVLVKGPAVGKAAAAPASAETPGSSVSSDDSLDEAVNAFPRSLQPQSSIDRIEMQAKESLAKLKHLLYKLRSRSEGQEGQVRSTLVATPAPAEKAEGATLEDEQQIFVSQKIEVDLSSSDALDAAAVVPEDPSPAYDPLKPVKPKAPVFDLAKLKDGLEMQLDAVTATRAIVTFDEATHTAVVTVTATVRAAEFVDREGYSEKAIAMATKALARTCLELDEKAHTSAFAPLALPASDASAALQKKHANVCRGLLAGSVVAWQMAGAEYGCTPFRPVYIVKLVNLDGSTMEALFKPCLPGDRQLRWKRAPEDLVAYQLSSVLGMDVAPPAVMRSGVTLGGRTFDLGVMVFKPTDLVPLVSVDPKITSYPAPRRPDVIVSDIRILDALMGNALRQKHLFLASVNHWTAGSSSPAGGDDGQVGGFHPLAVGQPMGPNLGCGLHGMWTGCLQPGVSPSVQVISRSTLAKLRSLSGSVLLEAFNGVLNVDEVECMLSKRDHILAYFEGLSRKEGWTHVCV